MGILTIKEELIGLVRTILFFVMFFSAGLGAVSIVKLLEWLGNTLSVSGWENKWKLFSSDLILLGIMLFLSIAGLGIAYISRTISNRLMIKPTSANNLPQSTPYVTYGKWIKIAVVPKKKH